LSWRDRTGRQTATIGIQDDKYNLRLSPDGKTIAFATASDRFWFMDSTDGKLRPTSSPDGLPAAVWAPDGNSLVSSRRTPDFYMVLVQFGEAGTPQVPLPRLDENRTANDWSRNGYLLYERQSVTTSSDLLALPMNGSNREPVPVAVTPEEERRGRFSPDGRWLVYDSNDGERTEVYVQKFPGSPDSRKKISLDGGWYAQWGRGGAELYFLSPDNHLMAAGVTFSADGQNVTVGRPAPLFKDAFPPGTEYEAAADGERFLVNAQVNLSAPPITVLSNWDRRKP
jgi:hypothetical protein